MNEIKEAVNYNANESENVKSALINITTERASNLNVQDASGQNAKIKLFGISKQEGTPSPKSPSEIENTTGNVKITSCNKNLFNIDNFMNYYNLTETGTDGEYDYIEYTTESRENNKFMQGQFKENTQYTISFIARQETTKQGVTTGFVIMHTDGTRIEKTINNDEIWTNYVITSITNKTIDYIAMSYYYSGTVWLSDIQLEENNIKTDYIKNEQQIITFPLSQNQKMFEGSYLANDGIHHKRKQIEFDGTEDWIYYSANDIWARPYLLINDKKIGESNDTANVLCNKAKSISWNEMSKGINEYSVFSYSGDRRISISVKKEDLETQDEAGVKKYFQENNMIVEYNLEEETIEAYTKEQQTQYNQLQNAKTYKTVTNVFTDNAEVEMNYIADTKTYIDNKYNSLAQQILEIVGGN